MKLMNGLIFAIKILRDIPMYHFFIIARLLTIHLAPQNISKNELSGSDFTNYVFHLSILQPKIHLSLNHARQRCN